MLSQSHIVDRLRQLGVVEGSLVMQHMSYKSLGPVAGGAETIVDAFVEAVGSSGTVLFPTFNFTSWTREHYWNRDETSSEMGIVSELARRRPESARTPHPIYSFAALGARADEFAACDDREAFGDDSVFGLFHRLDGIIVSLGLHLNSTFSMHHYVERVVGADYRRIKLFGGLYVDSGEVSPRIYSMFVRNDATVKTWIVPGMEKLVQDGAITVDKIGEAITHYAQAGAFFDAMSAVVRDHPEMLHEIVGRR